MILNVSPSGEVRCLYTEAIDLDAIGTTEIRRASHVEHSADGWRAQIIGGPLLGPFAKRSEALAAEVEYLERGSL
jgi:hypothetical protein